MKPPNERASIKENKFLYIAAISFFLYSLIEIGDSIAIVLISLNIIPNLYLEFNLSVPMIRELLESQPFALAPFFWAFTTMRVVSTIGLFRNLLWGFWIGIISLLLTMILTILFLPIGAFELLGCSLILILLTIGYFKDKSII